MIALTLDELKESHNRLPECKENSPDSLHTSFVSSRARLGEAEQIITLYWKKQLLPDGQWQWELIIKE